MKRLFGFDVAAYLERAAKYEKIGKLGMARLELEEALELFPLQDAKGREKVGLLLDKISSLEQEDAESRAKEALKRGDQKKARYYLNVALSKLEEDDPAYDRIVEQLSVLPEDDEEAALEDELETILRPDVGVDFLGRQRTLEFWKSGFPPYKEEYYFNKALTSDLLRSQAEGVTEHPDDADARFNFSVTLAQSGLVKKALEEIRCFVALRPEDRDGHYFLANLLADQGYDDEAIREFEKTIAIDPDFLEAYYYLARHYSNLEDWDRACRLFEHVIEHAKGNDIAEDSRVRLEAIKLRKRGNAE